MTVSVTVPNSGPALKLAAEFLEGMSMIAPVAGCDVTSSMASDVLAPPSPGQAIAEKLAELGTAYAAPATEPTPVEKQAEAQALIDSRPAVTAPTPAPAATVEPEQNDLELDIEGLPWDERIHSRGRSKNADGSWRMKRGVDEALIAEVKAEHIHPDDVAVIAAPAPAPAAPAPEVKRLALTDANDAYTLEQYRESGWTDQQLIDVGKAAFEADAPLPAAPTPAPTPAAPADGPTTPQAFLPWVMQQTTTGKFTVENVAETIVAVMGEGKTMADVAKQPDQIPAIHAALVQAYGE